MKKNALSWPQRHIYGIKAERERQKKKTPSIQADTQQYNKKKTKIGKNRSKSVRISRFWLNNYYLTQFRWKRPPRVGLDGSFYVVKLYIAWLITACILNGLREFETGKYGQSQIPYKEPTKTVIRLYGWKDQHSPKLNADWHFFCKRKAK